MNPRQQTLIAGALWSLMAVTRLAHLGFDAHLPDASLAVFFTAALLALPTRFFAVLCISAFAADLLALSVSSSARHCISPAYAAMLLTCGVMWLGGRWALRKRLPFQLTSLAGATALAFLMSSGSYYWLSGRFLEPSMGEFIERIARYLPNYFVTTFAYGAVAVAVLAFHETSSSATRAES